MSTNQFRQDALFVSKPTRKALWLVSKAMELPCTDQLAEQILNDWLTAHHPEVCQHVADQQKTGEAFAKELHEKLKPKRPLE